MLDVEDARALITTSLSDADLEVVIAREESWLAHRIGPLEGERVETFVSVTGDEVLELRRIATSVLVADDGGDVDDVEVRTWSDVVRTSGSWRGGPLVTYTPTDEEDVRKSLISLVRLAITESGYASEGTGDYSVASDEEARRRARWTAWRSLLRPARPTSIRITSGIDTRGRRVGGVLVSSSGS